MLYTFTKCQNIYELYVAVLGCSIFMAVACSIVVSLDRRRQVPESIHEVCTDLCGDIGAFAVCWPVDL